MSRPSIARAQAGVLLGRGAYLHGAAFMGEGDRAGFLAGVSGAGKSTLLRQLTKCGMRPIADDAAIIFRNTKGRYLLRTAADDLLHQQTGPAGILSALFFIEKGGTFHLEELKMHYAYYRMIRDGMLWSDVYRYHADHGSHARARADLFNILRRTDCWALRYNASDPLSCQHAVKAVGGMI